jgi:RNA recognition motif-containing protein
LTRIFVASIPYSVTETQLSDLFSDFGPVSTVRIVTNRETGESKGYGFVDMETQKDAERAVKGMNGYGISGRKIHVAFANQDERAARA